MNAVVYKSFVDELMKIKQAGEGLSAAGALGRALGPESAIGRHLAEHGHAYDLGGLGILALPPIDTLQHQARKEHPDKWEMAHAGLELGGLGTLAAPVAAQLLAHKK